MKPNKDLAPITLFTYNRLLHTRRTVEALLNNDLANESRLIVFSDGPKSSVDQEAVFELREYLKTIEGFASVEIIEREKNWGLAENIISGVTEVVNRYGRIIVLEDDILTAPGFLKYMNEALDLYESEERVMHISAYIYPINKEELPDTFFLKPTSCWGWGTWKDAWQFFEKNPDRQKETLSEEQIFDFNLDGSYPYWDQVLQNYNGEIDTWAVFWYLSSYLRNGLSLHPRDSLVRNIGHDGTGVNSGESLIFGEESSFREAWNYPAYVQENIEARMKVQEFFLEMHRQSIHMSIKWINTFLKKMKKYMKLLWFARH